MIDFDDKSATACIETALLDFASCAEKYHQEYKVNYFHFSSVVKMQLEQNEFLKVHQALANFSKYNRHLNKGYLLLILLYSVPLILFKKLTRLPAKLFARNKNLIFIN
jgi:hypothetical protein